MECRRFGGIIECGNAALLLERCPVTVSYPVRYLGQFIMSNSIGQVRVSSYVHHLMGTIFVCEWNI